MTLNKSNPTFNPKPNNSLTLLPYPYVGFVKNNTDPQFMGRLGVWIPEICGDPLDRSSWIICSYCSPFAGSTNLTEQQNYQDPATQTVAQQSYGWIGIPPDIDVEVMVIFVGGDIHRAYWIGCTYQQNMNHMIPGIPMDTTYPNQKDTDGDTLTNVVPVMEYNKAGVTGSPTNVNRPVFQPLATGLIREGLMNDLERGPSTTGMRRESPPLMSGWLSPRGNTIHIDDNATNEFIRLRTRSGAQVLIHETSGYIYINSKDGNSWFEISDKGINGYTNQSINMRAQGDINLISGANITFEAASNIFMKAGADINAQAGANIIGNGGKAINLSAPEIQIGATGGNLTMSASGNIYSNASGLWARHGSQIQDNSGDVPSAKAASSPQGKSVLDVTPVQQGPARAVYTPGGGTINTIASTAPTHGPWQGAPNANVPPTPVTTGPSAPTPGTGQSPAGNPNAPGAPGSCPFGVANTKPISTIVFNAIKNAVSVSGVDGGTMFAFGDIESSFNPNASASTSSAKGLFQFTDATWNAQIAKWGSTYNVPSNANIFDPVSNSLVAAGFIKGNSDILTQNGLAVNAGNLYIMHFIGSGGGPKFIQQAQSNPSASAASLFPGPAQSNSKIFYDQNGPKSMSQVYTSFTTLITAKQTAYASQLNLPAPCDRVTGTTPGVGHMIDPANAVASAQTLCGKYWYGTITQPQNRQQCVALLQSTILNLPSASSWTKGQGNLSANPPTPGTGIATFNSQGRYVGIPGAGTTHAAIYLGPADSGNGIKVLEQFTGSTAHIKDYQNGDSRGGEYDARNYSVVNINK